MGVRRVDTKGVLEGFLLEGLIQKVC